MPRLLALLAVLVAPLHALAQPCDPYTRRTEVRIPRQLQLRTTCGNGRIDAYATSCTEVSSGGCGYRERRSVTCVKRREVCDGRAFGETSCKSLGYARGPLRCAPGCERIDVSRCSLCLGGACRERSVTADDFEDVTLIAQGKAIRAFWTDAHHYKVADVDANGGLGTPTKLAELGAFRVIPVQVGTSALAIVGAQDQPRLSVVPARGAPALVPLPGRAGALFMPVVPVAGKPLAIVIVGEPYAAKLALVDAAGKARPLAPVYGRNTYRRAALVPLAAGKHVLRWSKYEVDIVARRGDLLWVMHDYRTFAFVVRNGGVVQHAGAARTLPAPESAEVALDGTVVASFKVAADVIAGVTHAAPAPAVPSTRLLAPIAYNRRAAIARTRTREVHAARVLHGPDPDPDAGATLAIAVRSLAP